MNHQTIRLWEYWADASENGRPLFFNHLRMVNPKCASIMLGIPLPSYLSLRRLDITKAKLMKNLISVSFASLILLFAVTVRGEEDKSFSDQWPQWRGPSRDGVAEGEKWPASLNRDNFHQTWRVKLGPSYSGPIVSKDTVFTTETKDKKFEVTIAYDRISGDEKWKSNWQGAMTVPFFAASNGSWIRSTPAYDGERLYVAGMRDVLVCLDAKTGDEIWKIDFVEKFKTPLPSFGFVCSPLVEGQHVYVQAGASFVKVDKYNGNIVWRSLEEKGGMSGSAFSSPVIETLNRRRQLVVQTRKELVGVDIKSGEPLWKQTVPAFRGMNILTPIAYKDGLFTSSYQNGSWLYQTKVTSNEWNVSEKWKNNAQGYMSSPVVFQGHAYLHLQNRRFTCIDLTTGERKWTSQPFGKYASLVTQGSRILALDSGGKLLLIEATPDEFKLIDSLQVSDDETWAHLAVVNDEVFIRELKALAAYKWNAR